MRVLNDFYCVSCGTTAEHFLENTVQHTACQKCGEDAKKVIQPIAFQLPGNDPQGFPTAAANWEKKRKQKMAEELKADNS